MQRYESYKPSGIQWVEKIPSHWGAERAKWLFNRMERPIRPEDDVVTAFRDGQVTLRTNRRTEGFTNAIQEHGYQGIRKGDLVIHAMDAFAGAIGVSDSDGKSTPVYAACIPRGEYPVNNNYYAYLLRYMAHSGYIESLSKGIRERSTDFRFAEFRELPLPIPDKDEQDRIVVFLDQKTAEIDAAIVKKERLASLLKEQQFKLINLAVTKGMNPSAAMTCGGAAWIESYPAHWQLMRIKHVLRAIVDTEHKTPPMYEEGPALMVRTSNVKNGELVFKNAKYTDEQTYRKWTRRAIPVAGDILFTREAPAGEACVLPDGIKAAIGQRMVLFKVDPERLDPHFAVHSIYSGAAKSFIELLSVGSTVAHFNMSDIGNIPLLLPPLQEQQEIATRIKSIQRQFQPPINSAENGIEKLQELKHTLITSAVLGQIMI